MSKQNVALIIAPVAEASDNCVKDEILSCFKDSCGLSIYLAELPWPRLPADAAAAASLGPLP